MMSELWEAFWFFLPAGIANMSPVLASRLPLLKLWNTPLDLGLTYKGKRLTGDSKTWRGLLFGSAVAALVGLFQYRGIASSAESVAFIIVATGSMGFGALLGDAVESFFKRQRGKAPGESWFPFDQLDYIVGGVVFALFFVNLSLAQILQIVIIYFGLHLIFSYLGYLLKLKKRPL
jgi:CDP-2,3-bis-(O-geranylgeranyl)-sn-glycerol synthase